jgi:signal transduction histidine kinase
VPLPAPERAFSPAAALDLRVPERPQAAALAPSEPGLFRWECGVTGEIDWVEGAPRAALIGRSISEELNGRFSARLPFSDEALAPAEEGPLAGEWRWSGAPAFFPDTGRFAGYRGIARRNDPARAAGPAATAPTPMDSDSLRELIHELRTPLNAIIGFGEMIDGQFLGPAHSAYRDRAAQIVRQARRLLGAVDDLDFAAKLQSGRVRRGTGTPLDTLFPLLNDALTEQALARGVSLRTTLRCGDQRCALELALAERLLRRFGEAVISAAATGEHLELLGERAGRHLAVSLNRPLALRGMEEEAMLDPSFGLEGSAGIGTGFALRLVRGLATMAGGGLDFPPERLVLLVPLAAD